MSKRSSKPQRYRSAKSGRYVTRQFAVHHPATTVSESAAKPKARKGGK